MKLFGVLAAGCGLCLATPALSQTTDAIVRVVDIGAGLCVVIAVPGGHGMLYDAGPPGATRCRDAALELVPGHRFDLVVLSHSDNDHISTLPSMLRDRPNHQAGDFSAAAIIHPGDPRGPALDPVRAAIDDQARRGACVYNLRAIEAVPHPARPPRQGSSPCPSTPLDIVPGDTFPVGAGTATFVAGWGDGNLARSPGEASLSGGPLNNNLSIVIRFEYGGHSVLLTGDTVGRMLGDPPGTCAYAERIMANRASSVPIASDVLIGQHHGADNSSSECFLNAVGPRIVIFSAGHAHQHPTAAAATRVLALRPVPRIFRTDYGDDEGGFEWSRGRRANCVDRPGDDDVQLRLPRAANRSVRARYLSAQSSC
jgi:competence protein ComEC